MLFPFLPSLFFFSDFFLFCSFFSLFSFSQIDWFFPTIIIFLLLLSGIFRVLLSTLNLCLFPLNWLSHLGIPVNCCLAVLSQAPETPLSISALVKENVIFLFCLRGCSCAFNNSLTHPDSVRAAAVRQ